ncbi:flagellar hook protein FlgE [Curvivirga aplysinae]|uniref:flagellar hook protein FlgE n=1 Tax=Curvivirga aplysinae TaxID=2529852 RepID=UPI0012BD7FFF|nr:flagellar hook protein FlgE [Curvivirga aplysinae]MTI09725.1 flagellar hook protein FlgE [Curvivirga aplysinae]
MSTLSGALNAAVSGLYAQSTAISTISTNIANVDTVSYKEADTSFSTLVTNNTSSSSYSGSGVTATVNQNIELQGIVENSTYSTHMAIDGEGFFVVSDESGDSVYYTRAGDFEENDEGYLVNDAGYYLMGYPVDESGEALSGTGSTASLEQINLDSITGNASATENVAIDANLPADAAIGDTFTTDIEVYDSLGTSALVELTWTKTAANEWTATYADPSYSSDTSSDIGDSTGSFTLNFDSDGNLTTTTPDPAVLDITGWTTGASDSSITFDFSNVTQFTDADSTTTVTLDSISKDGVQYGDLKSITVDDQGYVIASFENGTSYPVYQVPVATFSDPNELQMESGNAYSATYDAGDVSLNVSGEGSAGTVSGYSLEASTVDNADQLTRLIVAQQAYSSAAQVITATDDMFDALLSATR